MQVSIGYRSKTHWGSGTKTHTWGSSDTVYSRIDMADSMADSTVDSAADSMGDGSNAADHRN